MMKNVLRPATALQLSGVVLVTVLTLTACSSSGTSSAGSKPASGSSSSIGSSSSTGATSISIKNFMFSPSNLTVKPGAKVTVTNHDSVTHTVTATSKSAFNTMDIGAGKTVTFTAPTKAGSYPYICDIHPYMKGTLTVS
jgi:plastocyanin